MAECRDLEPLFARLCRRRSRAGRLRRRRRPLPQLCPPCRDAWRRRTRRPRGGRRRARDPSRVRVRRLPRRRCEAHAGQRAPRRRGPPCSQRKTWVPLSHGRDAGARGRRRIHLRPEGRRRSSCCAARRRSRQVFRVRAPPTIIPDAKALGRKWAEHAGWAVKVPGSEPVEQLEFLGCAAASRPRADRSRDVQMARPAAVGVRAQQRARRASAP